MYNDDRLYDAFDYNRRPNNDNRRPNNDNRRPNNDNRRPNNEADNFDRNNEKKNDYDRRPAETGDRRNWEKYSGSANYDLNRYSGENPRDTDRYLEKEKYNKRYPTDRYTSERHTFNIYDADRTSNRFSDTTSYGSNSDRVWGERKRYPSR